MNTATHNAAELMQSYVREIVYVASHARGRVMTLNQRRHFAVWLFREARAGRDLNEQAIRDWFDEWQSSVSPTG